MKFVKLIAVGVALLSAGFTFAQKPIRIKVGSEVVSFESEPIEVRGVTMVPIRTMLDSMGGTMRWDMDKQTLSAWRKSRRFNVVLNSRSAVVNDKATTMEEASLIYKNRIYVPLKFLADAAGYSISMEKNWYVLTSKIK